MSKTYSKEEREQALKLAAGIGVTAAGRQIEINPNAISNWKHRKPKALKEIEGLSEENKPYRHESLLQQIYRLLDEDPENANYGMHCIYEYLRINCGYTGGYGKIRRICHENYLTIRRNASPTVSRKPTARLKSQKIS